MVLHEEAEAIERDDALAAKNRKTLSRAGVLSVLLSGFPGGGKSALIQATTRGLRDLRCAAVVSSFDATRDAQRLRDDCCDVVAVNTPRLEPRHITDALASLDLAKIQLLFIETGSVASVPVAVDFGQHLRVGVFSVCGGDDKASQCPSLVRQSSAIVLGKVDLLQHVSFNVESFRNDVRQLNPHTEVFELSAMHEQGMDAWVQWLRQHRELKAATRVVERTNTEPSEWWFG